MTLCYFTGDSFVSPQLAAPLVARNGWTRNTPVDGVGGSGYINATAMIDRLPALIAAAPDVVVVLAGQNDAAATDEAFTAAVDAYWTGLRVGLPTAELWGTFGFNNPGAAKVTALMSAIGVAGGHYVDWTPWLTGTGRVGSETGDGNADLYLAADDVHPAYPAGPPYFGLRMAHVMRSPATGLDY